MERDPTPQEAGDLKDLYFLEECDIRFQTIGRRGFF